MDKRKAAPRKMTAEQEANEGLKVEMVNILQDNPDGMTATDVANAVDKTVQKVAQLLRQLKTDGLVTKTEAKGKVKARFYAA
jgi:DNA-binding transcriptional regulator GbsR (MarR family)